MCLRVRGMVMALVRRSPQGYRVGDSHPKAAASNAVVKQAREMHERGRSYGQIGAKLGVNKFTVRDWVTYRTRIGRADE